MPDVRIGRLRGGYCAYWLLPDGRRSRRQLDARTRKEAEAEAVEIYRKASFEMDPRRAKVSDLWAAYVEELGDKPTAKTMGYTGKAVLSHFGEYFPENIDKRLCEAYAEQRTAAGKKQGSIHTELGHLKQALNFAVKKRMIERAP